MSEALLRSHRDLWRRKPALRAVYGHYYREIAAVCRPGRTLEIGGGTGNLKSFMPDILSSDIQHAPWLDVVADAQNLPFAAGSFDNIVMFDVLHHLDRPIDFLRQAAGVLVQGGRIVVCEPAITPLSQLFYRHCHPEPVDLDVDLLADAGLSAGDDPWDSNQAIPTLLFGRDRARVQRRLPGLDIKPARRLAFLAYPLCGGFRPWTLLPAALVAPLMNLERLAERVLGPVMAFRLLGVIEKTA